MSMFRMLFCVTNVYVYLVYEIGLFTILSKR